MSKSGKKMTLGVGAAVAVVSFTIASVSFVGCEKKITGGAWVNTKPIVRMVNVPPDSSTFSTNPTIFWSGTDVDGRVIAYRYVVILASEIPGALDPVAYALNRTNVPDSRWTRLDVTLTNPQSNVTVRLQADLNDPVRSIVRQYFFLQAVDDDGAYSSVVWRIFGRNAHFPETRLFNLALDPYVNFLAPILTPDGQSLGGVPVSWIGTDSLDYLGEQPALEYEWRLYGPFSEAESLRVISTFINKVFRTNEVVLKIGDTVFDTIYDFSLADTNIDSTVVPPETTITVHIADYDTIPVQLANDARLRPYGVFDTLLNLDSMAAAGFANRISLSSFNDTTQEVWVNQTDKVLFDLFGNDNVTPGGPADTTRENTFIFWVRSRDDATVMDPTPGFVHFNSIEARNERDLMVIDFGTVSGSTNINGQFMSCATPFRDPSGLDTNKHFMSNYVSRWAGSSSVGGNASFMFDTGTFQPCGEDSARLSGALPCTHVSNRPAFSSPDMFFANAVAATGPFRPTLRDILKHKVVILYKDYLQSRLMTDDAQKWLLNGALTGMGFWTMSRAAFQADPFNTFTPYMNEIGPQAIPGVYSFFFGIRGSWWEAWYGMGISRASPAIFPDSGPPVRNESFIGAVPVPGSISPSEFPELSVNSELLGRRLRWNDISVCPAAFPDPSQNFPSYPYYDTLPCLPEVGYLVRTDADPVYLFKSRYGQDTYPYWPIKYDGRVVAVRKDLIFLRTSHWNFTPSVMDSASFQVAFSSMMNWLFEPWGGPSNKVAPANRRSPIELASSNPRAQEGIIRVYQYLEEKRKHDMEGAVGGRILVRNSLSYNKAYKTWSVNEKKKAAAEVGSAFSVE